MSYAIEVQVSGEGERWTGNSVRLATPEEAQSYAAHKHATWMLVTATRVSESADSVNYAFINGRLVPATQREE